MGRARLTSLIVTGLVLTGCASVATRLPDVTLPQLKSEQIKQEGAAFAELSRLQAHLDRVAYPVLRANTALCPKTRYDIGIKTHTIKSYSKALRPAAARELGAMDVPSVIFVRPGSAAQRSGVQRGDILIDADGNPVTPHDKVLQTLFKGGERNIRVRRGADTLPIAIEPVEVCGYPVRLSMSTAVNAYANGRRVTVTSGLINFTQSDAELALIIGHEMGHNTMGHIRKIVNNVILTAYAKRYTRPFELEADYVGLYYAARAGFDLDNVEDVWRRMGLINPRSVARAKTHPTYPDRYLRMAAARDEIAQKTKLNEPLVPNFKTKRTKDDGS